MTPLDLQRHLVAFAVIHGGLGDFGTRADGVRDDDGKTGPRTRAALATYASRSGIDGDGWDERAESQLEGELAVWPSRMAAALGFRALVAALSEWLDGVKEEPMGSNTGPRVRQYFEVCERAGKPIQARVGEWCAASASWCTAQALRQGEAPPHGLRIGGAELEGDLKRAEFSGRWQPVQAVRSGAYLPSPGDLVILDRSTAAAAWQRHVCRLVALRGETLWTIGGNESNEWRLTPRKLGDAKLLGFGAYPREAWSEADERRVAELCPGTAARMVSEAVCS